MTTIQVDDEFICICREIVAAGRTESEWAQYESDDLLRSARYEGGFDSTEMAFCFSLYDDGKELRFQIPLHEEIKGVRSRCFGASGLVGCGHAASTTS